MECGDHKNDYCFQVQVLDVCDDDVGGTFLVLDDGDNKNDHYLQVQVQVLVACDGDVCETFLEVCLNNFLHNCTVVVHSYFSWVSCDNDVYGTFLVLVDGDGDVYESFWVVDDGNQKNDHYPQVQVLHSSLVSYGDDGDSFSYQSSN